jgi:hypothetical protein
MPIRDESVRTVPATIAVTTLAFFVLGVARAQDLTPQVMHVRAPEFPPTVGLAPAAAALRGSPIAGPASGMQRPFAGSRPCKETLLACA